MRALLPALRRSSCELRARLSRPADIASLAAFRIAFGVVMAWSVARFAANGWIAAFYVEPLHHFTYPGFGFVRPWPPAGMYAHHGLLFVCALGIATGYGYRIASVGFFVGFTYAELIDQSLYLNHYYLVSLLSALLCVAPAERAWSLATWRRPATALTSVPAWVLLTFRVQVGLVYCFAGVAKLNADWLLEAQPLRIWLASRSDWPVVGGWLGTPEVAFAASWLGALFDLSIVPLLSWRRTRGLGCVLVVTFHALTGLLFPIGVFPWLMTVAATLLLPADWPRRLLAHARTSRTASRTEAERFFRAPAWLAPALTAHCVLQATLPCRQHFSAGKSAWTLDGFNFAWNVMVAEKAGTVSFRAVDRRTGERAEIDPSSFLARFQVAALAQDPELLRQAARMIAARYQRLGREVSVYAEAFTTLNGRPARRLVDPAVDLTAARRGGWISSLD